MIRGYIEGVNKIYDLPPVGKLTAAARTIHNGGQRGTPICDLFCHHGK
jgi:hypothetical protein